MILRVSIFALQSNYKTGGDRMFNILVVEDTTDMRELFLHGAFRWWLHQNVGCGLLRFGINIVFFCAFRCVKWLCRFFALLIGVQTSGQGVYPCPFFINPAAVFACRRIFFSCEKYAADSSMVISAAYPKSRSNVQAETYGLKAFGICH